MKKNWSYVAAMMLIAASGVGLTGCIDNDEPAGIEKVRVSLANLLEAKKAIFDAEAKAKIAQAEIDKIEAEIRKIQAEQAKEQAAAQAEINRLIQEAQLAKEQAEAAKIQAEADSIRKKFEMDAADKQAQIDRYIAETENYIRVVGQQFEETLYTWEQTKLKNAAHKNNRLYRALEAAYDTYLDDLKNYNDANEKYLAANRDLKEIMLDLQWVPESQIITGSSQTIYGDGTVNNTLWYGNETVPGKWVSPKYQPAKVLRTNLITEQADLDEAQLELTKWTDFKAALEEIETNSDIAKQLEEYEAKQVANQEAITLAQAELAALKMNDPDGVFAAEKAAKEKYDEAMEAEHPIAEYRFPSTPELETLGVEPDPQDKPTVEAGKYSLKGVEDYEDYTNAGSTSTPAPAEPDYLIAIQSYKNKIAELKAYLLDANDQAWTQARIAELTRQLSVATATNTANVAAWTTAKTIYNDGGVPVVKDVAGQADMQAAVDAYNQAGTAFLALVEKENEALTAHDEAKAAYKEKINALSATDKASFQTWASALKTYDSNMAKAQTAYDAAIEKANNLVAATEAEWAQKVKVAENDLKRAQDLEVKAKAELAANPTGIKTDKDGNEVMDGGQPLTLAKFAEQCATAATAAKGALTTAKTNQTTANENASKQAAQAKATAERLKVEAENEAWSALDTAESTWKNSDSYDASLQPLWQAWKDAEKALTTARNNVTEAETPVNDAWAAMTDANKAQKELLQKAGLLTSKNWNKGNGNWRPTASELQGALNDGEFIAAVTPLMYLNPENQVYSNARQLVKQTSEAAYGVLTDYDVNDEEQDKAFLVPEVTEQMVMDYIKAYIENYNKNLSPGQTPIELEPYQYYTILGPTETAGNLEEGVFGTFGDVIYLSNRIKVADASIKNSQLTPSATQAMEDNLAALQADYAKYVKEADALDTAATEAADAAKEYVGSYVKNIGKLFREKRVLGRIVGILTRGLAKYEEVAIDTPDGETVESMKAELAEELINAQEAYDKAKEDLDFAQYQLDQYNNGYADIENPYEITVKRLKEAADEAYKQVQFSAARVKELQERYDKATGYDYSEGTGIGGKTEAE